MYLRSDWKGLSTSNFLSQRKNIFWSDLIFFRVILTSFHRLAMKNLIQVCVYGYILYYRLPIADSGVWSLERGQIKSYFLRPTEDFHEKIFVLLNVSIHTYCNQTMTEGNSNVTLLLIDQQVSFHPGGSLAIPTANEDAKRLSEFLKVRRWLIFWCPGVSVVNCLFLLVTSLYRRMP